jgi:hypothetical protein
LRLIGGQGPIRGRPRKPSGCLFSSSLEYLSILNQQWQIVIPSGISLSFSVNKSSLTTFSPSGKLAQIEYALAAVGQGLPSLGIRCSNGVVLASEKPHPSILSDQSSFEKISRITPDAGVVYSGMGPDSRVLVDKARKGAHAVFLHVERY